MVFKSPYIRAVSQMSGVARFKFTSVSVKFKIVSNLNIVYCFAVTTYLDLAEKAK